MNFPYVGPIPPYTNVPIEAQFYQPSRFVISDITLGNTTLVTTTEDVNYVVGQLVRLLIPNACGTYELNEKQGYVLSIPSTNQVEIDINSKFFTLFFNAPTSQTNISYPQIIAIGDISSGAMNSSGSMNLSNTIPGAFINISPQ